MRGAQEAAHWSRSRPSKVTARHILLPCADLTLHVRLAGNSMGTRPEVARRPFEDVEGLIELLSEQGCVIATGFTSDRELSAVHEHVQPHMNGYTEIRKDLFPPAYRWCGGIFGKSHVVRDVWMQHSPLVRILNHFLTTKITPPGGYEGATFESKPALAFSVTLDIGPGAKPQDIHRDDYLYLHKHDDATQSGYLPGRDMMLLMFVPGVKTVVENGATLVRISSHIPHALPTTHGFDITGGTLLSSLGRRPRAH